MSEHLRTAGLSILFLLSTIVTLWFTYVFLSILWVGVESPPAAIILSILLILMFRASLHLGRRLTGQWRARTKTMEGPGPQTVKDHSQRRS